MSKSEKVLAIGLLFALAGPATTSSNPLSITMEVEEILPNTNRATRRWRATVVLACPTETRECGLARVELRYLTPAGTRRILLPVSEDALPSLTVPFVVLLAEPDKEVVVALFETVHELRILEHRPSHYETILRNDLPTWIEALAFGDVDDDGLQEIVVGLADTIAAQLRVFHFDQRSGALQEEIVSGLLPQHVETVDVGDADNDGTNEIVAGLERLSASEPINIPRLRQFKLDGELWSETPISAPEAISVQDVKIADVDHDGLNEVVALIANGGGSGPRQVRLYRSTDAGWAVEIVTSLVTSGQIGAERLVVADVDGDGHKEIVTAYWGAGGAGASLVALQRTEMGWQEVIVSSNPGMIDGIAVGFFDENDRPDIITAEGQSLSPNGRVRKFEHNRATGTWNMSFLSPILGAMRDVDFGDVDNDGFREVLVANLTSLRIFAPDGSTLAASFPVLIDSALVADVDHDEPGNPRVCDLAATGTCTEVFDLLASASFPASTWSIIAQAALLESGAAVVGEPVKIEVGAP